MVRILGILAGLAMVFVAAWSFGHGAYSFLTTAKERNVAHEFHKEPKALHLASDGPFGKYDREQLQRGFQVYKEVCSSCHSLNFVAFRNLEELGYNEAEVKALASTWQTQIPDIDPKSGDPKGRKPIPADHFPSPFANETAARASNGNALPPDLSLITKAREGGAAYVYSLITGYADPKTYRNEKGERLPADAQPPGTLHFNPYFANLNIAMPPPLRSDGQVTYKDGTKPSVDQMAQDIAAFLTWTAEPRLENRHRTGLASVFFLLFLTILAYFAYQNIWHGPTSRAVRRTGVLDPENMAKRDAANAEAGMDHG